MRKNSLNCFHKLIILVALCLISVCSPAADYFTYLTSYGSAGTKDGQFMMPKSMAFSPDGKLLALSDTENNRVLVFSVKQDINATDPLRLELTIGDLWPWDNRAEPFDSADKYRERDFLSGRNPNYLTGRGYHGGQNKVRPGNMVPFDHFNLPQGICWLGTDTVLVADTGNHRVKALKLNGEVRWILGQEGWKDGYFHYPLGIYAGCDKKIYVTEPRSNYIRGLGLDFVQRLRVQGNRLQIFDKDLKPIKRIGHMHRMSGRDYRQFKDITRVWVAKSGDIYLADNGNNRVMVYDSNKKKKAELAKWPYYKLRYPNGIDGSVDGRIAITDTGNHKVVILDPKYKIKQIIGGFGTEKGHFSKPREARFGPGGNLYVLDTGNCRIQVFKGPLTKEFPRCPKPVVAKPTTIIKPKPKKLPDSKPKFSY